MAAMQRDELRMVDLETALELYSQTASGYIQIPASLTAEEEQELRAAVARLQEETRETVAGLDAKIASLRLELFGEPIPEPVATPEVDTEDSAEETPAPEPEPDAE
jgi:hypothetical protein